MNLSSSELSGITKLGCTLLHAVQWLYFYYIPNEFKCSTVRNSPHQNRNILSQNYYVKNINHNEEINMQSRKYQ